MVLSLNKVNDQLSCTLNDFDLRECTSEEWMSGVDVPDVVELIGEVGDVEDGVEVLVWSAQIAVRRSIELKWTNGHNFQFVLNSKNLLKWFKMVKND